MMVLRTLAHLDRRDIGAWPLRVRMLCILVPPLLIATVGGSLTVGVQRRDLASCRRREAQLKRRFVASQARLAAGRRMHAQIGTMRRSVRRVVGALPSRTEMPALLDDMSQAAAAAGLDTELFRPGNEVSGALYARVPIRVRMAGSYRQFDTFVHTLASWPKVFILGMHDIALQPVQRPASAASAASSPRLTWQGTLETYHRLEGRAAIPHHGGGR